MGKKDAAAPTSSTSTSNKFQIEVGKRVYSDLSPGQKQPLFNRIVAMATLSLYVGWPLWLVFWIIAAFYSRIALVSVVLVISTVFLPAKPVLWPAWNKLWVFKTWRQYFQYSYCFEEHLDSNKRYILAEAPHGTFPIGAVTAGTLVQTFFDVPIYSVAATVVFHIPFWRHMTSWIGSLPATKENFRRLLAHGSVAVVVGGIAEMYMCEPKRERIKLAGRKGFVRIALEEQVDGIVPVYYFGQSQVLKFGPRWLSDISRKLRVSLGFLYGVCFLPIPFPVPMYLVHGKPIPVPKVSRDDPVAFEKAVETTLATVVQGMQDLYERHRDEYGWKDRPLSIE